ncbi:hypothetical protein TNCV_1503341 [Trichonephila clavipes]|uniref:Uncharacterized protein n=1 Tax=Trichonephila clavipes TaxID=2585209 RepID=A0A8X6S1C6_TRICX|nr:hypothetical protein TNCV_1503341 [Trichonephila clavipes]
MREPVTHHLTISIWTPGVQMRIFVVFIYDTPSVLHYRVENILGSHFLQDATDFRAVGLRGERRVGYHRNDRFLRDVSSDSGFCA